MKRTVVFTIVFLFFVSAVFSQQTGYYNGTDGKEGTELKTALYDIIKGHQSYDYSISSEVFKLSDADPNDPSKVILVYTGRSEDNNYYGTGGNYINREHVWAKSHGDFGTEPPEGSDFHNLKPADGSVNVDRGNKDFDDGGTQHPEATGCYYDSDSWEPRDEVKGDIARIIFYMATRYEGENGEEDLQVVDYVNTYPAPEHGKLSTLLQWNQQDPPDAFERNRNNVIFNWQLNRNPFIDNPEFAGLIWNGAVASPIVIDQVTLLNDEVEANVPVGISARVTTQFKTVSSVKLFWGYDYNSLDNEIIMQQNDDIYSAEIPGQPAYTTVYYQITATDGPNTHSCVVYNYEVPGAFQGELTSIYDIQGQTSSSPFAEQVLSTTGLVTGSFGDVYFLQDGAGEWNGMMVYDPGRVPQVGDSLIIQGLVKEYYGMTEMKSIEAYYRVATNKTLPEPMVINTGDAGEAFEGVLIQVQEAECTDDNYLANYGMWTVDDGSGSLLIHNSSVYTYEPELGESYNITGPLNFDFDEWKIELRSEDDVALSIDDIIPEFVSVSSEQATRIDVYFSEEVDETSGENINNYTVSNGITVSSAAQHLIEKEHIILTVDALTTGTTYDVTVENVEDPSGNVMEPTTLSFTYGTNSMEEVMNISSLRVSPNPAENRIRITLEARMNTQVYVKIMGLDGRILKTATMSLTNGVSSKDIDISTVKPQPLLLIISHEKGNIYKKVLKVQ